MYCRTMALVRRMRSMIGNRAGLGLMEMNPSGMPPNVAATRTAID